MWTLCLENSQNGIWQTWLCSSWWANQWGASISHVSHCEQFTLNCEYYISTTILTRFSMHVSSSHLMALNHSYCISPLNSSMDIRIFICLQVSSRNIAFMSLSLVWFDQIQFNCVEDIQGYSFGTIPRMYDNVTV